MSKDQQYLEGLYQVFLIQALAMIGFGFAVFMWPEMTIVLFIVFFAISTLIHGIMSVILAVQSRKDGHPWFGTLFEGLFNLGIALVTLGMPKVTGLVLVYVFAIWAMVMGVLRIVSAIQLRKKIDNEFMLILLGLISIVFGLFLFRNPGEGIIFFLRLIAFFGIVSGIILTILALRFRSEARKELS